MPKAPRLTRSFIFFLCILTVQLGVFLYIALRPFTLTPPQHTYTVLGKVYLYPIFYYPNMIIQGRDGEWSIRDTHTTAPQIRAHAQWFFIIAGKISALLNIEPNALFIILQILGGIAVFSVSYLGIRYLLPNKYHLLALFFALGMEVGPRLDRLFTSSGLSSFVPAFDSQTLILRHFGLPHHTWAEALGLVSLILLVLAYYTPTVPKLIALFVTAFLATLFLPPLMMTIGLSVYSVFILWAIVTRSLKKLITPLIVATIAIGIVGIQTKFEFAQAGFPWNSWSAVEKTWWNNKDAIMQYASALLPYIPFFILLLIAVPAKWKQWSNKLRLVIILMAAWIIIPFFLIPISAYDFFPIANLRLVDGYHYLAAGILAAVGLVECLTLLGNVKARKMALVLVTAFTIGISALLSITYLVPFLASQKQLDPHAYPLTTTMQGIYFLRTLPKESGIMVRESFGEIITGFANVRVYIGGIHGFPDWLQRQWLANRFFSGTLPPQEALDFLHANDITYVFYGPDEQSSTTQSPLYPSVLQPIFQNQSVTVFKVR
ncbi:hypothetical protein A2Z00_04025 [Candidatus Gottesmanbacteria bacterium RBG_13_45_10]|uniref:Glycosyltransferase RgtA/B/C/D-like domain-containing protein n=1 Tax=Candidatus Gottesmanbacteria bacterium RBG_13_45_10 TaxID=1798370 RepID=A0A1F5ZHF0_9BACT|nr:MAG: hypothetical protein A2Z00_04025 [Candidatus Gottesmanbacteria bacterium RBG_13_45_10]